MLWVVRPSGEAGSFWSQSQEFRSILGRARGPETPKLNLALHEFSMTTTPTITILGDSSVSTRQAEKAEDESGQDLARDIGVPCLYCGRCN